MTDLPAPLRNAPRRTIRPNELHRMVPLAKTTIYEMERRGEFPRRFALTRRAVVWDLDEVEAWLEAKKRAGMAGMVDRAPAPDVRQRRHRPVGAGAHATAAGR